jgi:hypothetical protein
MARTLFETFRLLYQLSNCIYEEHRTNLLDTEKIHPF